MITTTLQFIALAVYSQVYPGNVFQEIGRRYRPDAPGLTQKALFIILHGNLSQPIMPYKKPYTFGTPGPGYCLRPDAGCVTDDTFIRADFNSTANYSLSNVENYLPKMAESGIVVSKINYRKKLL